MAKTISERKRAKFTGRGNGYSYLRLPHYVIQSPQWRGLSGSAVKFLVELASAYNGKNNGDLSLTRREAKTRGWSSSGTRDRAEQEALEAGFVQISRHGDRHLCTLYAITWEPVDDVGKGSMLRSSASASNLWQQRGPKTGPPVAPKQGQPT